MLWIATQDKKRLMHVKEVIVDGKKIEGVIGTASLDHWSSVLGKYESKERASEVFTDLFNKLEHSEGSFVTYTMPKE